MLTFAEAEHFEEVFALICELEGETLCKEKFRNMFLSNLEHPNVFYVIATDCDNVVGFVSLHIQQLLHHCDKIGELQEIIVFESKRNLGIGKMLFDYIKEVATKNGCTQLEVCCGQNRKQSHDFYQNQGMTNSHFKFTLKLV